MNEWACERVHLGHLMAMRKAGYLLASGPLDDQPDDAWRGLCIYNIRLETAVDLAAADPAVRRGRLTPIAFRWRTPKRDLRSRHPS
jgi:uncharacterized protein YciI